jgi:Ca2+-binding RTX toxin-like protein
MRRVLVAAACACAWFCASGHAASAATCSYDAATGTVTDQLAAYDSDTLYVMSSTGTIESAATGTCGAATVKNTNRIVVNGDPLGAENLVVSQYNGLFQRPKGPKKNRDIPISVDLGGADPNFFSSDTLLVEGSAGDDTIAIGTAGVSWNANGSLDVAIAHDPLLTIDGLGGNDTITAQGGYGAGNAYASVNQLRMFGESERYGGEFGETNTFTGRDGRDYIVGGGTGLQTMTGLGGDDALFAGNGYSAAGPLTADGGDGNDSIGGDDYNDTLSGGGGDDYITGGGGGDTISGGEGNDQLDGVTGRDTVNGDAGNDYITATDSESDTIDGGADTDTAYYDRFDTVTNVEQAFLQ